MVMQAEHTTGHYRSRVDDKDLAQFIVDSAGVDLLAGSDEGRRLRVALAETLDDESLSRLHAYQPGMSAHTRTARLREVADRKWTPGKRWAVSFVEAVGLPTAFAGVPGVKEGPPTEEIRPYRPLPPLHDYQQELVERTLQLLAGPTKSNRGLLSLPTGAGKTRTAVDALMQWWAHDDVERGCMLWIAQSDELCEQAVQSFRETWVDRGHTHDERRPLALHRLWAGTRPFPEAPTGVVVASINKLQKGMVSERAEVRLGFEALVAATRAVIVDEAHHVTADTYRQVLGALGVSFRESGTSRVPFIGLTATPYRGQGVLGNQQLARAFGNKLLVPTNMHDPIGTLRERGILSVAEHEALETGRSFSLTPAESQELAEWQRLPNSFVHRVGNDADRNRIIVSRLLELPASTPTLFFGCSVEQATAMAVLLRRQGRSAASVSAETRPSTRRFVIEEFRAGHLEVLCNFGVLTTGFDAPKVETVVIARPTDSPVLYEQMIGRGMRGPLNGGTAECRVVDLIDHITQFGGQMAYTRYAEYWA
jgi:superfamily II DNA or RNA helicase